MRSRLSAASLLFLLLSTFALDLRADDPVDRAHREIWRRYVDEYNVVLDYTDLDGKILRPTPEDAREHKPSALSWGVPSEDGPMFNGLYLDAMCTRWKFTGKDEDRTRARRLVEGLMFLASRGTTPGFIARGVTTDGKTTYPMGSNDQTIPWTLGIWRYLWEGVAEPAERDRLQGKWVEIVRVLESTGWRMPCEGGPSQYRGSSTHFSWEGAPRMLFLLKAMHHFTGEAKWHELYLQMANERGGNAQRTRLEVCRTGVVFDPGQGPRNSWTSSPGVASLRALWEMETDPALREIFAEGLRKSAELCATSLAICEKYDPANTAHFEHDWRVMNSAWKPQNSEEETVAVANAGLRVQSKASPRLHMEKDFVREPCFAAWIVTMSPDVEFIRAQGPALRKLFAHYPYEKLYLSQFFPIESAAYRMQSLGIP